MFREDLEYIFVEDGRDGAVRKIEAEDVDNSGGIKPDCDSLEWSVILHYDVLVFSSVSAFHFPGETVLVQAHF